MTGDCEKDLRTSNQVQFVKNLKRFNHLIILKSEVTDESHFS